MPAARVFCFFVVLDMAKIFSMGWRNRQTDGTKSTKIANAIAIIKTRAAAMRRRSFCARATLLLFRFCPKRSFNPSLAAPLRVTTRRPAGHRDELFLRVRSCGLQPEPALGPGTTIPEEITGSRSRIGKHDRQGVSTNKMRVSLFCAALQWRRPRASRCRRDAKLVKSADPSYCLKAALFPTALCHPLLQSAFLNRPSQVAARRGQQERGEFL